jgi:hypothetical protein
MRDSELHLLEFGIVTDVWGTLESANYLNVYTSCPAANSLI